MSPSFGLLCLLGLIGLVSSQQPCADPFKVGTYNMLQIPFAQNREKRLDATIDYLRTNQLDLDVLCLQEVWEDDDRQDLVQDLKAQYPYSFWAPRLPQGECQGGCSSNELSQLRDCIDVSDCILGLFDDDDRYDCINDNCRNILESVGSSCSACLLSNDDFLGNIRNLDNCLSDDQPTDVCYAFDAWSDNLILSRVPLYDTQVLAYNQSPITYTTALYARVNTTEVGFAHIACTHLLPADLPAFTYEEANNLNQTQELLQFIDARRGNSTDDIVILMGDFNNGPNEWEANHDVILNAGYASAYLAAGNTNCTYCASNPLVSDAERSDSLIIDHIYIHNVFQTASTRFLTFYDFNIDRDGNGDRIPLSDHYGVRADLCPGPTPTNSPLAGAVNVNDSDNFEGDIGANSAAALAAGLVVTIAALAL